MVGRLISNAVTFNNCWKPPANHIEKKSVSIVIPVYYPEHLSAVIKHLEIIGGFDEIILVDDTGAKAKDNYVLANNYSNIIVLFHKTNLGRAAARNTGAAYATGEILVFMDQDMFLCPDFIDTAKSYYSSNESMIFLGLRNTVSYGNIPRAENWFNGKKELDWRILSKVERGFIDLTVGGYGSCNNNCSPDKEISIFELTDHLRTLGIEKNHTIGYWDLPSMVISHTMAIKKMDFFNLGGFPEWIIGWGGEDIVLGFLACAAHIPIFLSECVSFQAYHAPYSGSEEKKIYELKNNINNYRAWANEVKEFPNFMIDDKSNRALCKLT